MNKHPVWRLRILYVFMLILVVISVVPLSFYGIKMMQTNQDTLKTQEQVLQTITSKSLRTADVRLKASRSFASLTAEPAESAEKT